MPKTIAQINQKIKKGEAVVVTKEEILNIVEKKGIKASAEYVDVVTTGTFGPMCSSMALFNIGHTKPKMKIQKAWLNDVPCYCGLAAVDMLIGATELPENDPANLYYPGEFKYGGAHVIEELAAGKDVRLKAAAHGTDCYPRKELTTLLNIRDLNECWLLNPRNCYQNYNAAVNASEKPIYTYMGMLRPSMGNANYCSAGQLSPLLNDPYFRVIGTGTRVFLAGGIGYVFSHGTQHAAEVKRTKAGVPLCPAGTLAVQGDLKQMSAEWLRAVSLSGYGVSLAVGIGVAIPLIDEEMLRSVCIRDEDIFAPVIEYSTDYPQAKAVPLAEVSYKDLRSGMITVQGKNIPTASLSSYHKALQICGILKEWIAKGRFFLTQAVNALPAAGSGAVFKSLKEREIK